MTPDAQWFYTDAQQQQLGPVSLAQLQQLAASGQVQANQLVWTEGMANWTPASQIPDLFQQAAPAAPAAPAPAVVTPAAQAAPAASPYAAPATQSANQPGQAYPAPFVKKTSFMLYLGASLLSILVLVITFGSLAASAPSPPDFSEEERRISQAETKEEMIVAREALEKRKTEFRDEITDTTMGFVGLGLFGLIASIALSAFAAIYGYVILYRAWHILQPGGARTTPGAAIGFLFIPLFNLYWIFNVYVGWSTDWNRIRSSYPDLQAAPMASRGLFIGGIVCMMTGILAPVGLVLILICKKQMCDTINFFANRNALGATANMPQFV